MYVEEAYNKFGIDASYEDELVLASFYKNLQKRPFDYVLFKKCLETIADHRNSHLLQFAATLTKHINDENMALTTAASSLSTLVGSNQEGSGEIHGNGMADLVNANSDDPHQIPWTETPTEKWESEDDKPTQLHTHPKTDLGESSCGTSTASESEGSLYADSKLTEHLCDEVFDGERWVLCKSKDCAGHEPQRCDTCGWELHGGRCLQCQPDSDQFREEETEDESTVTLFFDPQDQIYRCATCQWEIEADDDETGYCYCNTNGFDETREPYFIKLSDLKEFNPADSDSSVADSEEEQANSEDEGFIDDEGLVEFECDQPSSVGKSTITDGLPSSSTQATLQQDIVMAEETMADA